MQIHRNLCKRETKPLSGHGNQKAKVGGGQTTGYSQTGQLGGRAAWPGSPRGQKPSAGSEARADPSAPSTRAPGGAAAYLEETWRDGAPGHPVVRGNVSKHGTRGGSCALRGTKPGQTRWFRVGVQEEIIIQKVIPPRPCRAGSIGTVTAASLEAGARSRGCLGPFWWPGLGAELTHSPLLTTLTRSYTSIASELLAAHPEDGRAKSRDGPGAHLFV